MTMIDTEDIVKRVARLKALLNQANAECFSNLDKDVREGRGNQKGFGGKGLRGGTLFRVLNVFTSVDGL